MPFDFEAYDTKCNGLTVEELQREWQHYTRVITGAATSTTVSGLSIPLTAGVSTIGVAISAPIIHNARKKRDIIERHLSKHNTTHSTRKRDVVSGVAVSGTIGVVTLGVGTMGADAIAAQGAEHGVSAIVENDTAIKVVTHAALDGAGLAVEHAHTNRLKKRDALKAFRAAGVFDAVKNAKAAEAGYSQPPYNPHTWNAASSSQSSLPPPPPPYNPAGPSSYTYGTVSYQQGDASGTLPAYYEQVIPAQPHVPIHSKPGYGPVASQETSSLSLQGHQMVSEEPIVAPSPAFDTFSMATLADSLPPVTNQDHYHGQRSSADSGERLSAPEAVDRRIVTPEPPPPGRDHSIFQPTRQQDLPIQMTHNIIELPGDESYLWSQSQSTSTSPPAAPTTEPLQRDPGHGHEGSQEPTYVIETNLSAQYRRPSSTYDTIAAQTNYQSQKMYTGPEMQSPAVATPLSDTASMTWHSPILPGPPNENPSISRAHSIAQPEMYFPPPPTPPQPQSTAYRHSISQGAIYYPPPPTPPQTHPTSYRDSTSQPTTYYPPPPTPSQTQETTYRHSISQPAIYFSPPPTTAPAPGVLPNQTPSFQPPPLPPRPVSSMAPRSNPGPYNPPSMPPPPTVNDGSAPLIPYFPPPPTTAQ